MQASSPSILALFNHSTLPSTFFLTCFPSTIQPTPLFCILSKLCSRLVSSIFLSINYSTISKHEEFSINIKEAYKFFSKEWKKKYDKKIGGKVSTRKEKRREGKRKVWERKKWITTEGIYSLEAKMMGGGSGVEDAPWAWAE